MIRKILHVYSWCRLVRFIRVHFIDKSKHSGNLLRTPDGRLCILDWGMVTRLDEELQLTLIEHVAHLTSSDYEEIPSDLLKLGFIAPEKAEFIRDSGVVQTLAGIYGEWKKGGGAANINVNDVVNQLQDLTAKKGNLFQIPPYFAYIAKSFSVLEGIGLSNDKDYSIIDECLPYISKRLVTDKDRCGPALSTFIFGPEKSKPDRVVDYKRIEQLVDGFGSYTTAASGALLGKENSSRVELLEDSAERILDLVLVEEETPLQSILLEQLVKILASNSRSFLTRIRERSGVLPSGRTVLGTIIDPLGVWRTSPLVRMNEKDEATVETTRKLAALIAKQVEQSKNPLFDLSTLTREESLALASILGRKVWERRNGVIQTTSRFAQKALELTAQKLERGERDTRRLPPPQSSSSAGSSSDQTGISDDDGTPRNDLSLSLPPAASGKSQDSRLLANDDIHDGDGATLTTVVAAPTSRLERARTVTATAAAASPRLQQARRLLNDIQKEEERNILAEVAPLNLPHVPYEDTLVN
jgi:ABC1 atypical kinase-like domain